MQCRRPWFNSWVGKIRWRRNRLSTPLFMGFPCGSAGKEPACNAGDLSLIPGLGRSPGEGKGLPTSVFWPGEFHGPYSPWGCKEADMTERLSLQMKCSHGISDSLEEISSLSHSLVFLRLLLLLHWSLRRVFLSLLAVLWNSAFRWTYVCFSPLHCASLLFSAVCRASSDGHFVFLHLFFLGMILITSVYNVTNLCP